MKRIECGVLAYALSAAYRYRKTSEVIQQTKLAKKGVARRGKIGRCYQRITFASRENPPFAERRKKKTYKKESLKTTSFNDFFLLQEPVITK